MARRPVPADVLLALGVGLEMQAELLFVDAPRRDVLIARVRAVGLDADLAVEGEQAPLPAGGKLTAGPLPDRGFEVVAHLAVAREMVGSSREEGM